MHQGTRRNATTLSTRPTTSWRTQKYSTDPGSVLEGTVASIAGAVITLTAANGAQRGDHLLVEGSAASNNGEVVVQSVAGAAITVDRSLNAETPSGYTVSVRAA